MSLQTEEPVVVMLDLMERNKQDEQAREMKRLLACLDNMEQQYNAVVREVQDLKRQLAEMPEQRGQDQNTVTKLLQTLEDQAGEMRTQLESIREKIISCAKNAVNGFKRMGISALDMAVSMLGIKELLESTQEKIWNAMESTSATIQRVEDIGHELRSVGGHLKNAGRAVTGRETQVVDGGQEGRFQAVVLAPMRTINSMYAGIDRTIYGALGAVDRLEREAERNRGKREKQSVRRRLEKKKAETPDRSLPARAKKPYEAVR